MVPTSHIVGDVIILLFQSASIISTVIRLVHRWRTSRIWWDDRIAFLALLADIMFVVVEFGHRTLGSPNGGFLFSVWFPASLCFAVLWISRMSLALSIARVFPANHIYRRIAFLLAALFMVLLILFLSVTFGKCYVPHTKWYNNLIKKCSHGKLVGMMYAMMGFDFLADTALVVIPLAMLWKVKLPANQRRLVLVLFSASSLSVLVSIAFITLFRQTKITPQFPIIIAVVNELQVAISLLVCNLLVVTMIFYRMIKRRDPSVTDDDDDESSKVATSVPDRQPTEISQNRRLTNNIQTRSSNLASEATSDAGLTYSRTESIVFTSIETSQGRQPTNSIQAWSSLQPPSMQHTSNPPPTTSRSGPPSDDNSGTSFAPPVSPWSLSEKSHAIPSS